MWEEKERGEESKLSWEGIKTAKPRKANQGSCNLCNLETIHIMRRSAISLNSREELGGYCPHRRVHLLENIEENKNDLKIIRTEKQRRKQ